MVNRRAHYRLLLINLAAASYNIAVQWMTHILLIDLGLRRSLIGVLFPALVALVVSALLLQRQPRGMDRPLLASGFALQLGIWVLMALDLAYGLPLFFMWLQLFLVLTYAILAWKMLVESYRVTVMQNRANLNKGI